MASCGYPDGTFVNQTADEQATLKAYAKSYTKTSKQLTVNGKDGIYIGFFPKRKEYYRIIQEAMVPFFDVYVH